MKVRITHTVDIDPHAWDLNYGTGTDPAAVRADVRVYLAGILEGQVDVIGVRPHTVTTVRVDRLVPGDLFTYGNGPVRTVTSVHGGRYAHVHTTDADGLNCDMVLSWSAPVEVHSPGH